jgi:Spx/MgsR family transcriptional regulator
LILNPTSVKSFRSYFIALRRLPAKARIEDRHSMTKRHTPKRKRNPRARRAQFLQKPGCTTCEKARKFMQRRGYQLQFRDLWKEPLSASELEKLIGDRDHTEFLNKRSEVYRDKNLAENPPTRREAIRLMAKEPRLIRRPVILAGGRVVVGFDDKGRSHLF